MDRIPFKLMDGDRVVFDNLKGGDMKIEGLLGRKIVDVIFDTEQETLELLLDNGVWFRVWGLPDDRGNYPELDYQFDNLKGKIEGGNDAN